MNTNQDGAFTVYRDKLARASLVVEFGRRLWLVARTPGGWARRALLTMTNEARTERLTPAPRADGELLGLPGKPA